MFELIVSVSARWLQTGASSNFIHLGNVTETSKSDWISPSHMIHMIQSLQKMAIFTDSLLHRNHQKPTNSCPMCFQGLSNSSYPGISFRRPHFTWLNIASFSVMVQMMKWHHETRQGWESQDYRCNMNDESNDLQLLSGTANKSSIILLKVYTKKTCKKNTDFCCKVDWNFDIKVPTLQTQPEKCERLTTSYSSKRQLVSVPLKGQCSWSSTQRLPDKQTGLHMETSGNFED